MTVQAPQRRADHRDGAVRRFAGLQSRPAPGRRASSRSTASRPIISTSTEVADLLKGPQGHAGPDQSRRGEGTEEPIVFNIIRDEINRKSVPDAFW